MLGVKLARSKKEGSHASKPADMLCRGGLQTGQG